MSASTLFAVLAAFKADSGLPSTHRLILVCLADYEHSCGDACPKDCDRAGFSWPSRSTIGTYTSLSDRTIKSVMADLREHGWVESSARHDARGQTSNFYQVKLDGRPIPVEGKRGGLRAPCHAVTDNTDPCHAVTDPPVQRLPPGAKTAPPRCKDCPPPVQTSPPPGAKTAPNPIRDPVRDLTREPTRERTTLRERSCRVARPRWSSWPSRHPGSSSPLTAPSTWNEPSW